MKTTNAYHTGYGFTLVEIMVVVVIIGILVTMVLPAFDKIRVMSQSTRFVEDCRVFAGAAETYTLENGVFPTDTGSGALPDFVDYIRRSIWEDGPTIGGVWDVENNDTGGVGLMVGTDGFVITDAQLLALDERHDDGNLDTGNYRRYGSRFYHVIVE